jgi:hypothetical protein
MSVTVTYLDGLTNVGALGPAEYRKMEDKFPESSFFELTPGKLSWHMYLAFLAMNKLAAAGDHQGVLPGSFDAFCEVADEVVIGRRVPLDETP